MIRRLYNLLAYLIGGGCIACAIALARTADATNYGLHVNSALALAFLGSIIIGFATIEDND